MKFKFSHTLLTMFLLGYFLADQYLYIKRLNKLPEDHEEV